jgi:propionyl-CoA synthetase
MQAASSPITYAQFHRQSIEQPDTFWAEQARLIDWFASPQRVCNWDRPPFAKWFEGGRLNLCHNAVDRHVQARAHQPALIAVSTETGSEKVYTFAQLHEEVQRMAAALQSLGVLKGDRVLIYMPMIAEAAFAMLACARIGAIHCVVFGGFASGSLASRIEDAEPKVIVSADGGLRGGKAIAYKPLLDEAIHLSAHKPKAVLLADRSLARPATTASASTCGLRIDGQHRHQLHHLHQRHHR